jgi:LysM repeat protein
MVLLLAGCDLFRAESTPTPAPAVSSVLSTTTPPASATMTPTEEITATVTLAAAGAGVTPTATLTVTLPAAMLRTIAPLNVRGGPGVEYPVVAVYRADATVQITGQDATALWWRVVCPAAVSEGECWVINDERFVTVFSATGAPIALAQPVLPLTVSLTLTPCQAVAPAGWVSHVIQSGDTLSEIASLSGSTVAQLRVVNCLSSDVIFEGLTLFIPAPISAPAGPPLPAPGGGGAASGGEPGIVVGDPPAGVAQVLGFFNPNLDHCSLTGGSAAEIFIGTSQPVEQHVWERAQEVGVCVRNFSGAEPIVVEITRPDGQIVRKPLTPPGERWGWPVRPGDPLGEYTVTAVQGALADADAFTVQAASTRRILVLRKGVSPGQQMDVVVAGYEPGRLRLFIYKRREGAGEGDYFGSLPPFNINQEGEGSISFRIIEAMAPGRYAVYTGEAGGEFLGLSDPRVFQVVES